MEWGCGSGGDYVEARERVMGEGAERRRGRGGWSGGMGRCPESSPRPHSPTAPAAPQPHSPSVHSLKKVLVSLNNHLTCNDRRTVFTADSRDTQQTVETHSRQ